MQTNKILNNITIVMSRPLISCNCLNLLLPKTITRVCPKIQYPSFNNSFKPKISDRNYYNDNNVLNDSLSKTFSTLQNKTENDNPLDVKNPLTEFVEDYTQKATCISNTLLLTTDKNRNFISGLMSMNSQEYKMLQEQDINSKYYQQNIKFNLAKIIYILYGIDKNICLRQKFELIFSITGLDIKKMSKVLSLKKYTTLLQSILTYVCHDTPLTFDMLQNFAWSLDVESYRNEKITILPFIEAFIINKNLHRNSIDRTDTKLYLVNHENLQAIPGFSNMESMVQTKQRNSDLYIRTIFKKQILDTYMDVKTFSVSGFFPRNLLSITFLTQKEFLKEYNNITTTLQTFFKPLTNNVLKEKLSILMVSLERIKASESSLEEKASSIHNLLLRFKLNQENNDVSISLNLMLKPQTTTEFALFLDKLMQKIEHNKIANIETIFPSNYIIDLRERQEFLEYFVKDIFQDDLPLLEIMLTNMRSVSLITKN